MKLSRRQRILAGVFLAVLVSSAIYLHYANALTAILVPTATENNAWTAGTVGCTTATTGHTCVDEGSTGNDTDFIGTGTGLSSGVSTTFHIADQPNVGNATNLIVYYYARSVALNGNAPNADTVTMDLTLGGVPIGSPATQSMTTSFSWYSAQFSGNWTQAQVDDMKVTLTRTVVGGGNQNNADDNVQISSIYVSMTYTSPVAISQAAYRWFGAEKTRAAGVFGASTSYTTGTNPQGIVAAKYNDDDIVDLVVSNLATDNVSILTGNGDGTFAARVDYPVGDGPRSVVSADLNGDQELDLVTVNVNSANISVLIGNGDGTFATKADYATQTANNYIALGDFNNDQSIDIVTTGSVFNTYSILLGNGDGTFAAATNYAGGSGLRGVVAKDLNNDQNIDLVSANQATNAASVLMGNGDGTFDAKVDYVAESGNSTVSVADFDNDQVLDIVTGTPSTGYVSVLIGNGDGTFMTSTRHLVGNQVTNLISADVNGDQYDDVISFADAGLPGVWVALNNGDGTFAAGVRYSPGGNAVYGAVADVTGDGTPDIIAPNSNLNNVGVLPNTLNYPALAAKNTAAKVPSNGSNFRLRLNLGVSDATLSTGSQFKLRYQLKSGSCSTNPGVYADVTASTPIRYHDDLSLADKSAYVAMDLDPTRSGVTATPQTYNESNTFGSTSAVFSGRDGLWDLSLAVDPSTTPGTTYCLLATKSDNTSLNSYTVIPEITIPNSTQEQSNYRFYHNTNSVTPGSPLAAQNTKPNVAIGSAFRLRQLLRQTSEETSVGMSFKLQAAEKISSCSAGMYETLSTNASNGISTQTFLKRPLLVTDEGDGSSGWWTDIIEGSTANGLGTAYLFNNADEPTAPLQVRDFGFSVPNSATVTGVELQYRSPFVNNVIESGLYLTKDGNTTLGANKASMSTIPFDVPVNRGGSSDLWGTTLTPSEVNSVNFGARFSAQRDVNTQGAPDIEIDYIHMSIHYTTAATVASFTNNAGLADDDSIVPPGNDLTAVSGDIIPQSYSENETAMVRTTLQNGENGLWDFALRADESLIGKTYCFRMAKNDGTTLASYAQYPEVTFTSAGPTLSQQMRGGQSVVDGLKRPFNW